MNNEVQQDLTNSLIKEKRRDRLWRNIRSLVWIVVVIIYAVLLFGPRFGGKASSSGPYVAMVRLSGTIMPDRAFSARYSLPAIKKAFADQHAQGVILLINSRGGTAAQASIIHDRILELKKQYHKKVVVVGEDSLASGAYLIATAADKIYVTRDTLTGSIGVVLSGFGFVDAMQKLGITRRVFTAGSVKDRLDPFKRLTPEDLVKVKTLLAEVHQNFIQDVVNGRGKRLSGDCKKLFSGDFWTGATAVKLGLADGVGNVWTVMHKEFNVKHMKTYSIRPSIFSTILKGIGTELNVGLTDKTSPLRAEAY